MLLSKVCNSEDFQLKCKYNERYSFYDYFFKKLVKQFVNSMYKTCRISTQNSQTILQLSDLTDHINTLNDIGRSKTLAGTYKFH